jgi:hypothetical protein
MAIVVVSGGSACGADTVILQEGRGGYEGCTATTFLGVPADRADPATRQHLCLRGTQNQVLIKFDLAEHLRGKKLARARLEVFIPEVRNLRMICEVRCHPVEHGWEENASSATRGAVPGGWLDGTTAYGRGRPPGVVDSHELWEYDGHWFPHKYSFLGVPAGGKWIDFNITPLAREWLKRPESNHGVALVPVNLPDHRFPNTAAMDIPAPWHGDAEKRPRLVLEFEPLDKAYLVGMTHTLRKYCDFSTRYRFFGPFDEEYEMAMARNEFEGFQVLLYPISGPLEGVTFDWTDLLDRDSGAKIPRSDIEYWRQEVFPRLHVNGKIKDWYFHGVNFAMPDALVTARPQELPEHVSTPFWFTVRTRPETAAGTYEGTITARPANAPPRELKLRVQVWDYAIPEEWNFETMGQMIWDGVDRVHGEVTPEVKRRYIDFLLDHRFSPTEQYRDKLSPDLDDIPYCIDRGMSTIYLSGNFTGDAEALRERYEAIQKLGLIARAYVYIGDETDDWEEMRRRSDAIRRACPQAMIMIGGSFPRPELDGVIDIFDPQISANTNQVYSVTADQLKPLIAQAQSRGEKLFWYVAAGPMLPCPNVQMEEPLIASRVLFWMTWKFGVTGFEYYCYNIWDHNLPQDGQRWPDVPFYPRGWGETNGDGMLFYPGPEGPFSSVRFENIRDGIEDWESHYVLRDYAEALREKARQEPELGAQAGPLLARAADILAVPEGVCADFVTWTWEPEVLLAARRNLGDTIHEITKLTSEEEMLAVRKARKEAELTRQRAMLQQRAEAARE